MTVYFIAANSDPFYVLTSHSIFGGRTRVNSM